MTETYAAHVVELRARVVASQTAMLLARDDLIERLGDHMCGGTGGGPTRDDLKALARSRRTLRQAQLELAQFLMVATLATFKGMPEPSSVETPRSPSDPGSSGPS